MRRAADDGVPVALEIIGAVPAGRLAPSPEQQRIVHTISDLGLSERVTLHPQVPPAEVGRRLAGADVLLHASLAEGVPNVVLEAMACGTPVVTTDCGGVREAVTDGVEGYVVNLRDPDHLADTLTVCGATRAGERGWGAPDAGGSRRASRWGPSSTSSAAMYEELAA